VRCSRGLDGNAALPDGVVLGPYDQLDVSGRQAGEMKGALSISFNVAKLVEVDERGQPRAPKPRTVCRINNASIERRCAAECNSQPRTLLAVTEDD
jgi:hypothetical protein